MSLNYKGMEGSGKDRGIQVEDSGEDGHIFCLYTYMYYIITPFSWLWTIPTKMNHNIFFIDTKFFYKACKKL